MDKYKVFTSYRGKSIIDLDAIHLYLLESFPEGNLGFLESLEFSDMLGFLSEKVSHNKVVTLIDLAREEFKNMLGLASTKETSLRKIADLFTQICNSIELKSRERVQKENFVNGLKTGVSLCFSDITEEALVLVLLYHINARIEYYLNSDSKKIDSIFKKSAQYYTPIPCDDIKDKSLVEKFNSARFGVGMTLSGIPSYALMNYFKLDHVKYISPLSSKDIEHWQVKFKKKFQEELT